MTDTRTIVTDAIKDADGEIEPHLTDGDDFVAVFILDDDTQTHRIARSFPHLAGATAALADAPELYLGEYVIMLRNPLDTCVYPVLDADTDPALGQPHAFSEDYVTFA